MIPIVKYVDITPTVEIDQRQDIREKVQAAIDDHIAICKANSPDGKVRASPEFICNLQNKIGEVIKNEMIELGMDITVLRDPIDPQMINFEVKV